MTKADSNTTYSKLPALIPGPDFIFSQTSLQDLEDCRRRFYLRYMVHLAWPAPEAEPIMENEKQMDLGAAFHHLAHQYYLGIPAARLQPYAQEAPLADWWNNFLNAQVSIPILGPKNNRLSPEHAVVVPSHNFRLIAKYDLLVSSEKNPSKTQHIIDWKTSQFRPKRSVLEKRLQTIVYPFVLYTAHANARKVQKIQMVYWFTNFPENPEIFDYTKVRHIETLDRLNALVDLVADNSGPTRSVEQRYPMTPDVHMCRFCVYRSLCDRGVEAGEMNGDQDLHEMIVEDESIISLDQISEIEF